MLSINFIGDGLRDALDPRKGDVMDEPLLDIRGLKTHFATDDGVVQAVDGVDLSIQRGETLGVVGESGCGKTVTAMSVLKLIPMPPGRIVAGQILYQGPRPRSRSTRTRWTASAPRTSRWCSRSR